MAPLPQKTHKTCMRMHRSVSRTHTRMPKRTLVPLSVTRTNTTKNKTSKITLPASRRLAEDEEDEDEEVAAAEPVAGAGMDEAVLPAAAAAAVGELGGTQLYPEEST